MTTYKKLQRPQYFWGEKNGIIGTAHLSREGEWVDFRPARSVLKYEKEISFYPPKGIEVDKLVIKYRRIKSVDYEKRTMTVCDPEPNIGFLFGNLPEEDHVRMEFEREIPGFPVPSHIKEKWEEEDRESRERFKRFERERTLSLQQFREWAESLPPGRERRILFRWLNGREIDGAWEVAKSHFHEKDPMEIFRVMNKFKEEWEKEVNA